MKKNIKYVKDVLSRIKDDNKIKRDHLFYSIGVICVLFMFIREYNNKNEVIVEPIIEEVIVPIIKTRTETMTFKEKFRASRDYDILVDLIKADNKVSAANIERNRIIDELVNLKRENI